MKWQKRIVVAITVATSFLASAAAYAQQAQPPNIVIIWGDDIGQSNVSAYSNGMMATTAPAMIFIHADDRSFSAAFPQTVVQRLRPGSEAEIAFDAIPGRVFRGAVHVLVDAVSQGQLQASGTLLNPEDRASSQGLALVNIDIIDDLSHCQLPAGATAQVAVYSDHWRAVAVIRRVLLRMKAWLNYVV